MKDTGRHLNICSVPDEVRLRMRLICIGRNLSMAALLSQMVAKEWKEDRTLLNGTNKRKVRRFIKRMGGTI